MNSTIKTGKRKALDCIKCVVVDKSDLFATSKNT